MKMKEFGPRGDVTWRPLWVCQCLDDSFQCIFARAKELRAALGGTWDVKDQMSVTKMCYDEEKIVLYVLLCFRLRPNY